MENVETPFIPSSPKRNGSEINGKAGFLTFMLATLPHLWPMCSDIGTCLGIQ